VRGRARHAMPRIALVCKLRSSRPCPHHNRRVARTADTARIIWPLLSHKGEEYEHPPHLWGEGGVGGRAGKPRRRGLPDAVLSPLPAPQWPAQHLCAESQWRTRKTHAPDREDLCETVGARPKNKDPPLADSPAPTSRDLTPNSPTPKLGSFGRIDVFGQITVFWPHSFTSSPILSLVGARLGLISRLRFSTQYGGTKVVAATRVASTRSSHPLTPQLPVPRSEREIRRQNRDVLIPHKRTSIFTRAKLRRADLVLRVRAERRSVCRRTDGTDG
jgi:hypothetical protein